MFRQQMSGVINLSLPLIILYNLQPIFLVTLSGQIICSLFLGAYIWFLNYKQLQNLENTLQFSPIGTQKNYFESLITQCEIDPREVIIKYAYTNESIAMSAGKTIIVDPILWHDIQDDSQAIKVQEIFKTHIEPGIAPARKELIADLSRLLTPAVERFIFKHELGHFFYQYSYKKLLVIFMIGALATYCGIIAAVSVLSIHGIIAILLGMFVGGSADLFLTYVSNAVWKLQEEKKADHFAVQYSSNEDIQAAAKFFENHQDALDKCNHENNILSKIPSFILTGHQDGYVRSVYLLQLMSEK